MAQLMEQHNNHVKQKTTKMNGNEEFDPSAAPPFKIGDIRAAIPKHCWVKDPWRSMSYVLRDLCCIAALAAAAAFLNTWFFWPLYWVAQGTFFWAIFVLGHDCGHGSFSDSPLLNSVVGHILHSSILVPYHGWRISHRTHHQNHGHVENDESWVPALAVPVPRYRMDPVFEIHNPWGGMSLLSIERVYKALPQTTRMLRYTVPLPIFAYPLYLWYRSPGKEGSHFSPYSNLFAPSERKLVATSTVCWSMVVAFLVYLSFYFGPICLIKLYAVPYLIFVMWLDAVTYLHHHGYDDKLPWYRGKEWSYLRGGLTTVDRDYGIFNNIHHDIGTHVVHHLFPQIPHYHLLDATKAAKPVLGEYYREPKKSGLVPYHLVQNLVSSIRKDHYVSDTGDIVFYETDPDDRKIN